MRSTAARERRRLRFWLLPTAGVAVAIAAGFALPVLDRSLAVDLGLFGFGDAESARSVLATIATVTVSVAGLSFSIVVVALQLASQQLGPRVLHTFQRDRLNQSVLGVLLGAAVYALVLLTQLMPARDALPQTALAVAMLWALAAFAMFVAFIQHTVVSLQASALIARIAEEGRGAVMDDERGLAGRPGTAPEALARARQRTAAVPLDVTAPGAGFLVGADADALLDTARRVDGFARRTVPVGEWVMSGQVLGEVWAPTTAGREELARCLVAVSPLARERRLPHDPAFPVRQLADVALRALSPSLNDPTTARHALASLTDLLAHVARSPAPAALRLDADGEPRVELRLRDLEDLIRTGFEEAAPLAATQPLLRIHLTELLARLERAVAGDRRAAHEARRQARRVLGEPDPETSATAVDPAQPARG